MEERPGYGAAVHAGVEAARSDYVAVMDGDGSFDPRSTCCRCSTTSASGAATMATGRRRPVRAAAPGPGTRGPGNAAVLWWLRRRIGTTVHDVAPMRVCRTADLLALAVEDRRFGYPVELLQKRGPGGLDADRARRRLPPASRGTRSKVSGSVRGQSLRRP